MRITIRSLVVVTVLIGLPLVLLPVSQGWAAENFGDAAIAKHQTGFSETLRTLDNASDDLFGKRGENANNLKEMYRRYVYLATLLQLMDYDWKDPAKKEAVRKVKDSMRGNPLDFSRGFLAWRDHTGGVTFNRIDSKKSLEEEIKFWDNQLPRMFTSFANNPGEWTFLPNDFFKDTPNILDKIEEISPGTATDVKSKVDTILATVYNPPEPSTTSGETGGAVVVAPAANAANTNILSGMGGKGVVTTRKATDLKEGDVLDGGYVITKVTHDQESKKVHVEATNRRGDTNKYGFDEDHGARIDPNEDAIKAGVETPEPSTVPSTAQAPSTAQVPTEAPVSTPSEDQEEPAATVPPASTESPGPTEATITTSDADIQDLIDRLTPEQKAKLLKGESVTLPQRDLPPGTIERLVAALRQQGSNTTPAKVTEAPSPAPTPAPTTSTPAPSAAQSASQNGNLVKDRRTGHWFYNGVDLGTPQVTDNKAGVTIRNTPFGTITVPPERVSTR